MPADALHHDEFVPSFSRVTGFPARTIPASVALHIIFVSTILLVRQAPTLRETPVVHAELQHIITLPPLPKHLPSIEPSPAPGASAAGSDSPSSPSTASSSSGSDGGKAMPVVFQGAQQVISDAPNPTNTVQTILQPDAPQPQKLPAPLPVPSTVKLAAAKLPPAPIAPSLNSSVHMASPLDPTPAPSRPLALPQHADMDTTSLTTNTALVENPRLPQLVSSGRQYEAPPQSVPQPQPTSAAAAPSTSTPAPSAPSTASSQTTAGHDPRNLLVVNAIEPENASLQNLVPEREIHGRFQIVAAGGAPGNARSSASTPIGSGVGSGSGTGSGTSSGSGSAGHGSGATGAGTATGKGNGSGAGSGSGNGTSPGSSGRGRGSSTGTGAGSSGTGHGSGRGSGSGTGTGTLAGSGSGNKPGNGGHGSGSPFGGMSIAGGVDAYGHPNAPLPKPPGPHQAYGMTIIGSGSSGGGLRDFGVFSDGPVYTVYLDVSSIGIRGTRWSLQYGASRDIRLAHPGSILTPPYPSRQVLPHIPSALVSPNIGRMLVVQAILNTDGALDAMHVLQSPDERLNAALTDCLSHWSFDAATMGAERVPVKVLLGIPIAAGMAADTTATAITGQSN